MSAPNTDPLASSIAAINVVLMRLLMLSLTSHIIAEASTRRFAEVQGKTFLSRSGGFQQGVAKTCGLDETGPWSSFICELLGACRQATG